MGKLVRIKAKKQMRFQEYQELKECCQQYDEVPPGSCRVTIRQAHPIPLGHWVIHSLPWIEHFGSTVPWRTPQWPEHTQISGIPEHCPDCSLCSSPGTHIFLLGNPRQPCTKSFFKMYFIPTIVSDTSKSLVSAQSAALQDTVRVSAPHFLPISNNSEHRTLLHLNVENKRRIKGELATDQ